MDLVSKQEGHAPEQIVAAVIKKIATEKDIPPDGDISLQQVDGGNKLTVKLAAKSNTNYKKKNTDIKATTVANVKKSLNLSERDTEKFCRILRKDKVRVEPNCRSFLKDIDNYLASEYEHVYMEMEVMKTVSTVKKGKKKGKTSIQNKMVVNLETKDVAIVKDTKQYLELVVRERNLNPDTAVFRVVPDGGGGTFKVMVSVFDGNCDPEITFKINEVPGKLNT